ncbi:MAG: NUDIX domain-containing protein [Candidatus Azambacteria bacterium]|nr:NUDIX domain-containing protein [Candidatus Azambacteria bacterium]
MHIPKEEKKMIAYGVLGDVPQFKDKIALVLRHNADGRELWSLPGGCSEEDALIHEALVAQIQRETGFHVDTPESNALISICEKDDSIIVIFLVQYRGGAIEKGEDVHEVRFFDEREVTGLLHRVEIPKYQHRALTHYFYSIHEG